MSSGLDWQDADTLAKADPYLAWADSTHYDSYRLDAEPDAESWWLVLIEIEKSDDGPVPIDLLLQKSEPTWLQVPAVYVDPRSKAEHFRYCTARVRQTFFKAVLPGGPLHGVVARYMTCSPVEYKVRPPTVDARVPQPAVDQAALAGGAVGDGDRVVMALIDGGLALAHSAFRDVSGGSRIKHFWRQDDFLGSRYLEDLKQTATPLPNAAPWMAASNMGYGAELDKAAIDTTMRGNTVAGLLEEEEVYRDLGLWDLDRLAHHGTHVFSLAAGPYRYPKQLGTEDAPPDWTSAGQPDGSKAETCDLVAVQLAWANVLDTSGRSVDAHILDALMYILSRCMDDARLVVNLSWGGSAGPHDGSSILEQAMVAWCGLRSNFTQVVVPAGNTYQSRGHANAELKKDEKLRLNWRVQPECHTPSFLELWMDQEIEKDRLRVDVYAPDGSPAFGVTLPGVKTWPGALPVQATLVMLNRPNLSKSGSMVLIALQPTAGELPAHLAPSGVWRVEVTRTSESPLRVSAFVERNDVAMGLYTGNKQSHLEDERYNIGDAVDDDRVQRTSIPNAENNQSPVRRTGSFNHLSCGSDGVNVVSVGGKVHFPTGLPGVVPSGYSPRWGDVNDTRPRAVGAQKAPDTTMLSDESAALWGLRAAASRSGAVVRMVGTSSAVPLAVRELVNGRLLPPRPKPPAPPVGSVLK